MLILDFIYPNLPTYKKRGFSVGHSLFFIYKITYYFCNPYSNEQFLIQVCHSICTFSIWYSLPLILLYSFTNIVESSYLVSLYEDNFM